MKLSDWYASGGHIPEAKVSEIPDPPAIGSLGAFSLVMPSAKAEQMAAAYSPERKMQEGGKTRAGTKAQPFPWEEAAREQYERTKSRLKGLVTDPEQEGVNIVRQYLYDPTATPEENQRKMEEMAMGFAGTTIGKPRVSKAQAIESGLYHPVGAGKKLVRPIEEVEFTRTADPNMPIAPKQLITPMDLYKKQGYPVTWDVSAAGELLTGMGGKKFETPVVLQGGEGYQRTHGGAQSKQKLAVASHPHVIKRHSNIIQRIAGEGDEPVSVVLAMSPGHSLDYNKMMSNTLVQQLKNSKIPSKLAKDFDEEVRKQYPDFVGVKSKKLIRQLNNDSSGNLRKHVMNRMMLDDFQKGGFPDVAEMRVAISDPDMLRSELGSGGSSFASMDPSGAIIKDPLMPHETYLAASPGQYMGGLGARFSTEELFPTFYEQRRLLGGDPKDDWYTFGRTIPTQRYDQEWLDKFMPIYEQRIKEVTGKKKGGEVHMADGGDASLKNIMPDTGLAPYGIRHSGEGVKGTGYFGLLPGAEGMSSEISTEDNRGEFPLLVPTLTREEIDYLLAGNPPTEEIYRKAAEYAAMRRGQQMSPFAEPTGLKYPLPEPHMAGGGDPVTRTRAGVPVKDTNVLGGALAGLGETITGAGRGLLTTTLGGAADIANLLDLPKLMTGESYEIPYGSEYFKEKLPFAPTTQTGKVAQQLGEFIPIDPRKPVEEAIAGVRKLAPVAKEMVGAGLERAAAPARMYAVPPGEAKAGKVKAPANELGFYNPAEKAALNLQRKKGSGDTFISDLKKQPGVNDERITELGLDQFKGRPDVTKEEIIAASQERRIPLQESVKRELDEDAIKALETEYDELSEYFQSLSGSNNPREVNRISAALDQNLAEQKRLKSGEEARFGPSSSPEYNIPGGTDYREIRVNLPESKVPAQEFKGYKVITRDENPYTGQRNIEIRDADGKLISMRGGFRGTDEQALLDLAETDARNASKSQNFYHEIHHGDEPNVLFHLRVANHADEEGKKGLLIDELQSDWHQAGAKKGYKGKDLTPDQIEIKFVEPNVPSGHDPSLYPGYYESFDKNTGRLIARHSGTTKPGEAMKDALYVANQMKTGVPDAPFKDNWYQLGLKRAIKEAADTGMDRMYLTTGKRQIDRYENALRANVDAIEYEPYKGDNGELLFEISGVKNGQEVINKEGLTYKELEELVGKDMASKMKSNVGESLADERPMRPHWMRLSGDNLSIGGEGMKQWYDKTYKNYLEKYAKQHGGKLGMTKIAEGEPVYYIDITPQMKESAKKGQSYKRGGEVKKPTTLSEWYQSGKHLPN